MIKIFKGILVSMHYFLKLIFVGKSYDVVFVSSAFFNRGEGGENILLKPMIESCIQNNLSYLIFEDTDIKGIYKNFSRNNQATRFDFISMIQIILRKIFNRKSRNNLSKDQIYLNELKISKILKKIFFRKFHSKIYVTLLWNNITLWRCIDPKACIMDYQHGIIFDGHEESIKDGKPPTIKYLNNIITLVYGDTFKNILINNDASGFYSEKNVITLGLKKESYSRKKSIENSKKILFTLQIVPDWENKDINELYVDIVENLVHSNVEYLLHNNYEIILRNHPRFSDKTCPNVNLDYDFISFDNETPINDLLDKVNIHMTVHSTSTFEAAVSGTPSILIDMHDHFSPNEIFLRQYKYPFDDLVIREEKDFSNILDLLNNKQIYNKKCEDIYRWSKGIYKDFDKSVFKNLLLENIDNK